jgi:hypothetical protein
MDVAIDCDRCPFGREPCIAISHAMGIRNPISMGNPGGACILYNAIQTLHKTNNLDHYNQTVYEHHNLMKENAQLKKELDMLNEEFKKYHPILSYSHYLFSSVLLCFLPETKYSYSL